MHWVGKFIGGYLGFAFYGPIGFFAGVLFGHAIDEEWKKKGEDELSGAKSRRRKKSRLGSPLDESDNDYESLEFIVPTFAILGKLSLADGRPHAAERREALSRVESLRLRRGRAARTGRTPDGNLPRVRAEVADVGLRLRRRPLRDAERQLRLPAGCPGDQLGDDRKLHLAAEP